jgi:hypothetical protein
MADKDDTESRSTEEVLQMAQASGAVVPELDINTDDGDGDGETGDSDDGSDGDGEFDVANPFADEEEVDPLEKDPFDVAGVTEERVEVGRRWLKQMIRADNQVIQNQWGSEPNIEIVVPSDIYPEVEAVVQDARTETGDEGKYGLDDPSFAERVDDIHPAALSSFQFVLGEGDDIDSGPYDIEGIISAIEADDEPFLVTHGPLVDPKIIPVSS